MKQNDQGQKVGRNGVTPRYVEAPGSSLKFKFSCHILESSKSKGYAGQLQYCFKASTLENREFVGLNLHRSCWHVTVRTEGQELFSGTAPGHWEGLLRLLDTYRGDSIEVVYEAGYLGFWLHDRLGAYGVECSVTPPREPAI